jgi:hypothetical protein
LDILGRDIGQRVQPNHEGFFGGADDGGIVGMAEGNDVGSTFIEGGDADFVLVEGSSAGEAAKEVGALVVVAGEFEEISLAVGTVVHAQTRADRLEFCVVPFS